MAELVQVDVCPICSSPVFVRVENLTKPMPLETYSCRCRQVYPERFRVAGQHGYKPGRRR
jgi:hypothetical protein